MTRRGGGACRVANLGTTGVGAAVGAGAAAVAGAEGVVVVEAEAALRFPGVVAARAEAVPAEDGNHERGPIHRHDRG